MKTIERNSSLFVKNEALLGLILTSEVLKQGHGGNEIANNNRTCEITSKGKIWKILRVLRCSTANWYIHKYRGVFDEYLKK